MKKIAIFLLALFVITGCNNNGAFENAIKEGKEAIVNEEYDNALKSFESGLELKSDDEEVKILISQTKKMIEAINEQEDSNIGKAIALFEEVENMGGYDKLSEQAKERKETLQQEEQEKYNKQLKKAEELKDNGEYDEAKVLLNDIISEIEDVEYLGEQHERVTRMLAEMEEAESSTTTSSSNDSSNDNSTNVESDIPYPVFTDIKNEKQVNQLIADYINELDSLYNADNLSINYQIMFQSEQYVSIYFSGDLKGGAYPRIFKSTLNIDLTQGKRMTLKQIINYNDDFINIATNAIQEQFNSIGADMDTIVPSGIKNKLENADSTTSDVQSYFTSDKVVVILAIPHAIGDYIEVSIPFASVENYIK